MTALDDSLDALGGPAFDWLYDRIRPELEQFEARRGGAIAILVCASASNLAFFADSRIRIQTHQNIMK